MRAAPEVRELRIEWGISRRALGERAPAGGDPLVMLRFESVAQADPRWVLIDRRSKNRIVLDTPADPSCGETRVCLAGDCVHVHSPALYAFISIEHPQQPELLYVRTDVFARLGIAGGRYQPLGVAVELR